MANSDKAMAAAGVTPGELVVQGEQADLTPQVIGRKSLVATQLKFVEGLPYILTFTGKVFEAPPLKPHVSRHRKNPREAKPIVKKYDSDPLLAPVTYHGPNGPESRTIVVYSVLDSELDRLFPDDAYVGKTFEITMHRLQGKGYFTWQIDEVQLATPPAAEQPKRIAHRKAG